MPSAARAQNATDVSAFTQGPAAPASYSEEKPDYLYIKDLKVTRSQKTELTFDITLRGKIPTRTDTNVRFYIGFDIDSDTSTGSVATTNRNFGQDVGIWFWRDPKKSQFETYGGSVDYKGKERDLKIGVVKIQGDTISFKVRSELFSFFPTLKVFVSAEHTFYEKGNSTKSVEVTQAGILTVGS